MPRPMAPPMPPGNTPIGVELNPLAPSLDGLFPFQPRRPLAFTEAGQENFTAMVAAIGTGGIPRPNRRLVGVAPRLSVRWVPKVGSVALGWENHANALHARLTR